jgi:hypothetical protein
LTLRDLRRLATNPLGRSTAAWNDRIHGRLAPMPEGADLIQGARIMSAMAVGGDLIRLARVALRLDVLSPFQTVAGHIASGRTAAAIEALQRLDGLLAERTTEPSQFRTMMGARSNAAAIREALLQHSAYFNGEVRA